MPPRKVADNNLSEKESHANELSRVLEVQPNWTSSTSNPTTGNKKAAAFYGRGQSQSLIDKFGDTCLYCKWGCHWYSDCEQFWADVTNGKLKAPQGMQRPQDKTNKGKAQKVYNVHVDGSLLDSAADVHVSGINPDFMLKKKLINPLILNLASSSKSTYLTGIGSLTIWTANGTLTVDNVYFCEDICFTILSLGRLVETGYHTLFTSTSLKLVLLANVEFPTVFHKHCWYIPILSLNIAAISKIPLQSAISWHASTRVVKLFLEHFVPEASSLDWKDFFCDQCARSKSTRLSNTPATQVKSNEALDLLVSDVAGPFERDPAGNHFLLTLRDHASTFTFTAPLKSRAEVPEKILFWVKFLSNHLNKHPIILDSDNAGEYSKKLKEQLNQLGTEWSLTEPYLPDQNGEAERVNCTLGDMARAMLNVSPLPSSFCSYVYSCATHIHNKLPKSRTAPLSPMEVLFNIRPNPDQMYPFGSEAIVNVLAQKRGKLYQCVISCRLLTFPHSGNGWIFYNPAARHLFQASSAIFSAYQALPCPLRSTKGKLHYIMNNLRLGEVPTSEIAEEQASTIQNLPIITDIEIPKTLKHALSSPFASNWNNTAMVELKIFAKCDIWKPVDPFKG
ncbi:hypothetical protein O181_069192 [Austropuccinia psidii MF-1]|uniref:Integrase catalytic domain-containing protein n=1 Tax=Austropuccinia psidii MF-1 TaxID=1389203 RepID=A0A9Q3F0U4_9BASI|nr:hypothetical protein [Austropuccinia psidii MF-1]